ncbi:MAG: hypothetical protein QF578_08050 [Alphaproteobacteria bacterium]|nr:hypothetical protein [Alphaproteobacteria bacterium]MDP6813304.1 hypothetical protein [Alphaproteobacteria bacterium]
MTAARPPETPGAKMMYLIKRQATTTREELIAHWFANHMPAVIARAEGQRADGKLHATRYVATLFDPRPDKPHAWDGVAQLWYDKALIRPDVAHGDVPTDTFQEKVEPYWPWATREYVVMDGALPLEPPTLNPPFPCTRAGFFKVTFLVPIQAGGNCDDLFDHWLDAHVPNVRQTMETVGGFRYVVSHSLDPAAEAYAGMAELYFPDASGWASYREHIQPDGMEQWVDYDAMRIFQSGTEMVGIA